MPKIFLHSLFLSLVFAWLTPLTSGQAPKEVTEVRIETGWGGLGIAKKADIVIRRQGDRFLRGTTPISRQLIDALIHALEESVVKTPSPSNLGLSSSWLTAHASSAESHLPGNLSGAVQSQQELFRSAFRDIDTIAKIVPNLFRYTSFDDYPGARVQITFTDGSMLVATTDSYYLYMIPWATPGAKENWNAHISTAVAALMPPRTVNKDRLSGSELESKLTDTLMTSIREKWDLLGAESKAGNALNRLRTRYTLSQVDINPYHSEAFGLSWSEKGPHETNLHAILQRSNLPANFKEQLILEFKDGQVTGVDEFLQNAEKYETLARSVPWLNEFLQTHPKMSAILYQVHGVSFGSHALETFSKDMVARQRPDLIERVRSQQSDIALLDIGSALWLIFPDHHMMLWRYELAPGLLKWSKKEFPEAACGDYRSNYGGCSGREVSIAGDLIPDRLANDLACLKAWEAEHPEKSGPDEPLFEVTQHDRTGYIDRQGKIRIPLCFEAAGKFSEGLAAFERDKLEGYIDFTGKIIIEPKFPWAEKFSEGLALVQVTGRQLGYDGRWGYIDRSGKVVIEPVYEKPDSSDEDAGAFHEGRALVHSKMKYGFIDREGRQTVPPQFQYAERFTEGLALVTNSEKMDRWGYIDHDGRWAIPATLEWATPFAEGLAAIGHTTNCIFIDKKGNRALSPPYKPSKEGCSSIYGDFADGLARWKRDGKYGYIDRTGTFVIPPKFDLTGQFSEDLAAVLTSGGWGFINTKGAIVIRPHPWNNVGDFHNGLARVVEKSGVGYINRQGKYVWGPTPQSDH